MHTRVPQARLAARRVAAPRIDSRPELRNKRPEKTRGNAGGARINPLHSACRGGGTRKAARARSYGGHMSVAVRAGQPRTHARARTHTHTHDRCRWRFCWTTSCRRRRRWSGSSRSGSTRTRPAQTRCPPPGIRPHTRGAPATARPSTQTHPFPPWHRELLSSARPPPNALSTLVLRELVHLGGGGGRGDGGRCRTRWTR